MAIFAHTDSFDYPMGPGNRGSCVACVVCGLQLPDLYVIIIIISPTSQDSLIVL